MQSLKQTNKPTYRLLARFTASILLLIGIAFSNLATAASTQDFTGNDLKWGGIRTVCLNQHGGNQGICKAFSTLYSTNDFNNWYLGYSIGENREGKEDIAKRFCQRSSKLLSVNSHLFYQTHSYQSILKLYHYPTNQPSPKDK